MIDYHNLLKLALKLFGLALIIYAVISGGGFFTFVLLSSEETLPPVIYTYLFPLLLPLLCGIFLWLFPTRVTNTIVKTETDAATEVGPWGVELERIGVALIGLYLAYQAISELVYSFVSLHYNRALFGLDTDGDYEIVIFTTLAELAIALFLMIRSAGIVALIRRLRETRVE